MNQAITRNKYILASVVLVITAILILLPPIQKSVANYIVESAEQKWALSVYDIKDLERSYSTVLKIDSTNEQALYGLVRIYSITGKYEEALSNSARYQELYPSADRIHYVAGLTYAFMKNFPMAENEFSKFIESGLSTWGGYLDLAWVYFQQGEFEKADSTLANAVSKFGDNVWLNTSLGAVNIAIGDLEQARKYLNRAREQADDLTVDQWRASYSLNDPNKAGNEIEQMKKVIEVNLALANGEESTVGVAESLMTPFTGISPGGFTKGIAVSACEDAAPACATISCVSSANACGQTSGGVLDTCSNICSASIPALPGGYGNTCQIIDACGDTVSGTVGCSGECESNSQPTCELPPNGSAITSCVNRDTITVSMRATDPNGDNLKYAVDWDADGTIDQYMPLSGYITSGTRLSATRTFDVEGAQTIRVRAEDYKGNASQFSTLTETCEDDWWRSLLSRFGLTANQSNYDFSSEADTELEITAHPLLLQVGQTATITWSSENTQSCIVEGSNGDSWSGISDSRTSSPIQSATTYTLTCETGDEGTQSDSVTVRIAPIWQEF